MHYISFPGLGIEPFHIDKIAFSVFGRDVAWYGLLITFGMILAVLYANHIAVKREKLHSDMIIDLAFFIIVFGVIGARLYYVAFEWDSYVVTSGSFLQNILKTLKNIISVWNGGLAIYGGIIAGLITAFLFAKARKVPFIKLFDLLAPTVMIGQIIGRWGNFINMEAHGGETSLPWRMGLLYSYDDSGVLTGIWDKEIYVHPTFLYESLWNVLGFIILHTVYKKKKFNGQMFAMYLVWYGFGRMLIEGLRTDSLYLGTFRVSQLVGAFSVLIGLTIFFVHRKQMGKPALSDYEPVYVNITAAPATDNMDDTAGTDFKNTPNTNESETNKEIES